ncbi:MAG: hypothetical protein M5R41_17805 [Bacteroidia bacterium]|nr:hypothetical protein [Bacteroidia bacterium]
MKHPTAAILREKLFDVIDRFPAVRIITVAVVLRLLFGIGWALFVNAPPENVPVAGETWYEAGADGYIQIARTLLISGEYAFHPGAPPVHNRPPAQALLLLLFGAWLPSHWYMVWMFGSALLSLLMLLGVRTLGRELGLSRRAERIALLLAGFHPYLIFISKTTTFINLAALLLVAVALAALRIRRRPIAQASLTGLLCGVGALTHGIFLLLPLLIAPLTASFRTLRLRTRLLAILLLVVITATVVAPWTLRNMRTFDMAIPVVTGNGYHYWKGEAVYFGGDYPMADVYRRATGKEFEEMYYGAVDPRADAVLWEEAKKDMLARPWRIPQRLAIGSLAFFAPWDSSYSKAVVSGILNLPLLLVLTLFSFQAIKRRSITREHMALIVLLAYIVAAFAFFVAWGSYFTMILPVALTLAVSLWERNAEHTE